MEPLAQDFPSSRQEMNMVMMARAHARDVHKRCTMDILLKGSYYYFLPKLVVTVFKG